MSGDALLSVRDLHVHYAARGGLLRRRSARKPVRAIDGVSFDVKRGELLAIVGESGCGKTTLAKAITRLASATRGTVSYAGRDLLSLKGRELRAMRRRVQTVFQDPYESLDPRQTIFDIVAEPLVIHRMAGSAGEVKRRVHAALEAAGLHPAPEIAMRFPHLLSGGQRQRVSIAAAMILDPELIVADEPVSMLDVSNRAEILALMLDLRRVRELTYIFITHDLSLAWMIADRIMVLYLGRIVEMGLADDIIHRPRHPYTRALVSVMPKAGTAEKSGRLILTGETPSAQAIPVGCRFHPRCPLFAERGGPAACTSSEPDLAPVVNGGLVACHFGGTA